MYTHWTFLRSDSQDNPVKIKLGIQTRHSNPSLSSSFPSSSIGWDGPTVVDYGKMPQTTHFSFRSFSFFFLSFFFRFWMSWEMKSTASKPVLIIFFSVFLYQTSLICHHRSCWSNHEVAPTADWSLPWWCAHTSSIQLLPLFSLNSSWLIDVGKRLLMSSNPVRNKGLLRKIDFSQLQITHLNSSPLNEHCKGQHHHN